MPNTSDTAFHIPGTAGELRWLLAKRMGGAALLIGLLGGVSTYYLMHLRTEAATLRQVQDGVSHFASPAMRIAADIASTDHSDIDRLFNRTGLVGLRIHGRDKVALLERWAPSTEAIASAVNAQQHSWPDSESRYTSTFSEGENRIHRVVLPLYYDGHLLGYLEGLSLLTSADLANRRGQAVDAALIGSLAVLLSAALLYPLTLSLLKRTHRLSQELLESHVSLVRSLGNAIAKRDAETDAHNFRVTCYTVAFAETLELPDSSIADLVIGAFLHDLGKIGIPDHILRKPGKLTPDEFRLMQSHTTIGTEIIADRPIFGAAAAIIRHHHERFDGTGYPDGLGGETIPLSARIFALIDVFDALTSSRPYKPALSLGETMAIMEKEAGSHFDPALYQSFKPLASTLFQRQQTWGHHAWARELQSILCRYFKISNDSLASRCDLCR
ncbi:MAG: HD-GYP domain-containing protein [Candidatus Accumulibacter sp.]|uniref:HD-GYP domain-containing protein n=1 Tax=Accumulibacter sp. TaxID=2053492 RepID=UPI002878E60A|nr:HD-GYP domain-containing protein [Accumulibacter sp.]MDS4016065.1 HD-GYP domain-containing protein [Accumulibacter sp.]